MKILNNEQPRVKNPRFPTDSSFGQLHPWTISPRFSLDQNKLKFLLRKKSLILLTIIILLAIFLRTYRADQITWFFYDQGRDAKVIWDLTHNGNLFLIGPTTGLEGVFIGPLFYYLITPGYFLSGGDPAGPAIFLGVLNSLGLIFVYLIGATLAPIVGLVAVFLAAFSFHWIQNDRWLANPSPLSFFAPLVLWLLLKSAKNPSKFFPFACFILGLNLQLEASGSFFSLFSALIWVIVTKIYNNTRTLVLGGLAFFVTFLPQILFELRNNFLITNNLLKFVIQKEGSDSSFAIPTQYWLAERLSYLFKTFFNNLEPNPSTFSWVVLFVLIILLLGYRKIIRNKGQAFLFHNQTTKLLLIWILAPSIILIFYRGNYGYVFGYYLNPVIPAFFLLCGVVISFLWKNYFGKIIVGVFLTAFLYFQIQILPGNLSDKLNGYNTIALGNQKQVINWIYLDAKGEKFNTDVYVPPVIPHAYDYLFLWMGQKKYGYLPEEKLLSRLYTIYEYDSEKKRLEKWLQRQAGIGRVERVATFGGITVEKRKRYE